MTAPTLPDRHLRTTAAPPAEAAPTGLSTAGWSRLRRSITTAVFVVATVIGVTIGVRAIDVSPVAPPVAIGQLAPPAAVQQPVPATIQQTAPAVVSPTAPAVTQQTTPAIVQPPAPVGSGAGPRAGGVDGPGRGGGRVGAGGPGGGGRR